MIRALSISKFFWVSILILISFLFFAAQSFAQESEEEAAKKYNVTFPIAELGSCGSLSECRNFCEDPVNATTCINYAKSKGFYKEDAIENKKEAVLQVAKQALGCDSYESCLNFCSISENHDKCDAFAKRQGLTGGRVEDPSRTQVITKAKEVLGCDSAAGCQSLCSKEENRQKCSDFAKEVGLRGGEQRVGPGGCTSEATCQAFCSDPNNFQVCKGFTQSSGGQFSGPGGCNSEETCRAYCQDHENECRGLGGPGGSPPPGYNPQEICSRTPNCKWEGNTCQCGFYGGFSDDTKKAEEYAKFCRENPDKCAPGQTGGFSSEKERQDFGDYCRQNPDKCRSPSGGTPPPYYSPQPGYTPNPGGQYSPPPYYSPQPTYSPSSGGSTTTTSTPAPQPSPTSGSSYSPPPTDSGSSGSYTPQPSSSETPPPANSPSSGSYSPPPSEVQGVTTEPGLLQTLWQNLFH